MVLEHDFCHWDLPFRHWAALAAGFVAILFSLPADHGQHANLPHAGQSIRPILLGLLRETGNTLAGLVEKPDGLPLARVFRARVMPT